MFSLIAVVTASVFLQQQAPEPQLPDEIAGKELRELLEDWPDQYVKWIITNAEREVYNNLPTDEEKLKFIEFFWARRDPNPETVDNEYRAEYLERFAFVSNRGEGQRFIGWNTTGA